MQQVGRLATVREVAEYLNVSASWVRQHSSGTRLPQLPCIRLGGSIRYRMADVEQFVQEQQRRAS